MTRALGRLPHDQSAVAAAPRIRYAAEAPPPATLDRSGVNYAPQLLGNDLYPNCPVVGLLNAASAVEALATNGPLAFDPQCWVEFYAACCPCAPTSAAIAATDGLNLLDTLRRQGSAGFDIGAVAPLTGDFGMVPLVRADLAAAMARLGCLYVGIDLAPDDMETSSPAVWDRGQPSPTLGHCVVAWSYTGLADTDLVTLATWGYLQCVTWRGFEVRLREAYGLLLPTFEPVGVDIDALKAENARWLGA
jgi:hypothetical protein